MTSNLLYVVDGDRDSEEAIRILNKHGVQFKKIYVGKEGNGKSMWRDIGTTITPALLSPQGIFIGVKEIERLCSKLTLSIK